MRTLLVRGMIAGVLAGLATLVFAYVFGEPGVEGGIAFEEHAEAAAGGAHEHGVELVSRGVQSTFGLATAVLVYGVAIGGIFAIAFALFHGRVGPQGPRTSAAVLALLGWLTVFVVPFLKYPANPPGANEGGTIGQRTGLYLLMVLASLLVGVAALGLRQRLSARLGAWNATLVAVAAYLVVIGLVGWALPAVNETPDDFPATVLYQFRLASLGGQLVLWTVLGLAFGALVDRKQAAPAATVR